MQFISSSAFASKCRWEPLAVSMATAADVWALGILGWLWTGDIRQSDRSVEKTIPGLYEGQRRTLWTLTV